MAGRAVTVEIYHPLPHQKAVLGGCCAPMNERGRKPGFRMSDEHRVKIQNSNILNALIEHASGLREMSSTQVSAGLGLLKKVLPDLSAVEISGDEENPVHVVNKIERVIVDPKPSTADSESIPAST